MKGVGLQLGPVLVQHQCRDPLSLYPLCMPSHVYYVLMARPFDYECCLPVAAKCNKYVIYFVLIKVFV